jgi:CorA-like Mg2+ transporter protein
MRKTVTPQRDAFASLMGGVGQLLGLAEEDEHYFRDVYDHLIRISDLIDSYRDLLTGAMDVYLSTVSNRINAVMKQLTMIATIFLPLTFIPGSSARTSTGWFLTSTAGRCSSSWAWAPRSSPSSRSSHSSDAAAGSKTRHEETHVRSSQTRPRKLSQLVVLASARPGSIQEYLLAGEVEMEDVAEAGG